ncbi:MAG TPA: hypothetical protein VGC57_03205 [Cellulomonas sp.]
MPVRCSRPLRPGDRIAVTAPSSGVADPTRRLHGMRKAGWSDHATAVLVGRTHAPASAGWTHDDAVRDALGGLGVPVVLDVGCGHVAPSLTLVNGARATVDRTDGRWTLTQELG